MNRSIVWWWVARPAADLPLLAASASLGWWLGSQPAASKVDWQALLGLEATIIGILAAIITFACTALYGASAHRLVVLRRRHGQQIRRGWLASIAVSVASAVACLLALPLNALGVWVPAVALIAAGALGAASAATARSLLWLGFVLQQQDVEASVVHSDELSTLRRS